MTRLHAQNLSSIWQSYRLVQINVGRLVQKKTSTFKALELSNFAFNIVMYRSRQQHAKCPTPHHRRLGRVRAVAHVGNSFEANSAIQ